MTWTRRDGDAETRRSVFPLSTLLPLFLLLGGCQSISPRVVENEPPHAGPAAVGTSPSPCSIAASESDPAWSLLILQGPNSFYADYQRSVLRPMSDVPVRRSLGDVVVSPYALPATTQSPILNRATSQPLLANLLRLEESLVAGGFPSILENGIEYVAVYVPTRLNDPRPENARSLEMDRVLSPKIDAAELQRKADRRVALVLRFDRDGKLEVKTGPGMPAFRQRTVVPLLVRLENPLGLKGNLTVTSAQAGPVYGGGAVNSLTRQGQLHLRSLPENEAHPERTFDVEFHQERNSPNLASGLELEYGLILATAHVAGRHDVPLRFEFVRDGTATPTTAEFVLPCDVKPAVNVKLFVRDHDGSPTIGKFTFVDSRGQVHPSMPKRLAPDFFFQRHVYRADGETTSLPPGTYEVGYSRGPEYRVKRRTVVVPEAAESEEHFHLERWIEPQAYGFYSGDHHIHGAGCSHYTSPTEGVSPADMFRQVKGEGLNVGAVLTWGPCYDFQRRYFSADADAVSEPFTLLKYDVEVSGFGSQRLGHVCLLNLRDQTYPGSNGTSEGWPTWTVPVLRWTKAQGGVTGYAHSASGMHVVPNAQALRLMKQLDADGDEYLTAAETKQALLPEPFTAVDADHNGRVSLFELEESHRRAAETLPNYAIPELNGVGAMEACVAAAHGVCDFISSMDTARIQEWNTWYHLLNCGLPIATSGETDFPCMSGTRVGQGRTYVQLGHGDDKLNYADWCRGLAAGRSYVSDGYAHTLDFAVDGRRYGETVDLAAPGEATVTAEVAFALETPPGVKHGIMPQAGRSRIGDTVVLYPEQEATNQAVDRRVELIVNGQVVEAKTVPADGRTHALSFTVPISQSSWAAIRQFPQLHTNPIRVLVGGKPIRVSRRSAEWCTAVIEQLWKNRREAIREAERPAAERAYEEAKSFYRRLAAESRAAQLQ